MLLLVDPIAERSPASGALALQSALVHSPLDFLSEAFHKALKDNALGPVRYRLGSIKDLDSVPLELPLINGAVVFVSGEAVRLASALRVRFYMTCNEHLRQRAAGYKAPVVVSREHRLLEEVSFP